ncbi:putative NRAMP family protein [Lupinus albus]|uniref:Putative NRAMP family protein n=1 Tax=Lupinus albus TaxID=3870 RepID=A0A6A4R4M6_LUPAL|nr:putative NRAMP family protein [Lupinus albus]
MNAPANEFYSTDLVLLTLQDALSLIEQVLHSPIGLLVFLLILFLANQVRALTSSFGGEVVVHGYLRLYIPGWFHYAIVLVVLQLPSSVIPLFQIATSKSIMGVQKISQFVELLALAIFIGMLALNIVFVVEMMFGSSEWMGDLRWNVGNGVSFSYLVLFTTALASICSVLWLAATPLRSASVQLDAQEWNWDTPATVSKPEVDGEESNLTPRKYLGVTSVQVKEPEPKLPSPPKSLDKESASTSEAEAVSTGRRQLAAAKKLDVLLGGGIDSRSTDSLQKVDACGKEYSEYLASFGGRTSNTLMNSGLYDSSKQPRMQSSSLIQAQLLDAYLKSHNSSHNLLDYSERRYSGVRNLSSSEGWVYQPAVVHGYQFASYLNQALPSRLSSGFDTGPLWSRRPSEKFGVSENFNNVAKEGVGIRPNVDAQETTFDSDWLFRQNDGIDEDLIDRVAAREKSVYKVENREMNQVAHTSETHYFSSDTKPCSSIKNNEANSSSFLVSSVPSCGEGCIWRSDLIISFGVWCIHRILDLSRMESRPELWGKYTYILNRLQGITDPAFSKPRIPMVPCLCLQVPVSHKKKSSPPRSVEMLPRSSRPGRGKYTTASTMLDLVKNVEIAISSRKGRSGTVAGDVAFPWRPFSNGTSGGYLSNLLELIKGLIHSRFVCEL